MSAHPREVERRHQGASNREEAANTAEKQQRPGRNATRLSLDEEAHRGAMQKHQAHSRQKVDVGHSEPLLRVVAHQAIQDAQTGVHHPLKEGTQPGHSGLRLLGLASFGARFRLARVHVRGSQERPIDRRPEALARHRSALLGRKTLNGGAPLGRHRTTLQPHGWSALARLDALRQSSSTTSNLNSFFKRRHG